MPEPFHFILCWASNSESQYSWQAVQNWESNTYLHFPIWNQYRIRVRAERLCLVYPLGTYSFASKTVSNNGTKIRWFTVTRRCLFILCLAKHSIFGEWHFSGKKVDILLFSKEKKIFFTHLLLISWWEVFFVFDFFHLVLCFSASIKILHWIEKFLFDDSFHSLMYLSSVKLTSFFLIDWI